MITTNSQFIYDIALPQTDQNIGLGEELKNYTTVLEPKFLTAVLGYSMYKDLVTHSLDGSGQWYDFINGNEFVDDLGLTTLWNGFKTIGSNPIAYFIYFEWVREHQTTLTSLGTSQAAMQNSQLVSPNDKLVGAWNKMVELLWVMDDYLQKNSSLFPNYIGIDYPPFKTYGNDASGHANNDYFQTINAMLI